MSADLPMVPQTDPRASYTAHCEEIDAAVHRVLAGGRYVLGDEVHAFEQEFSAYIGRKSGIAVASGTDALILALRGCGVGPGDLVFTVAHTAVATVAAIELAGATPVLVDIEPQHFTMDPDRLEAALAHPPAGTPKAVVPVHLYGHPCDMAGILSVARRNGVCVIEDCAQAHGAVQSGRKVGVWGDAAAFSFYPTKNLGAFGDGGLVLTDDVAVVERIRMLRQYGWRDRYVSEIPGGNSRLDELQAALLRVKLRHLDGDNGRRMAIARAYDKILSGSGLHLPEVRKNAVHVFHQYVVRHPCRNALKRYLEREGIQTLIHYPVPVHLQPAYAGRVPAIGPLRHTEEAAAQVLSLPMFPQLTDDQVERVCAAVHRRGGFFGESTDA